MENKKTKWFYFRKINRIFLWICRILNWILFTIILIIAVSMISEIIEVNIFTDSQQTGMILMVFILWMFEFREKIYKEATENEK